ncbi:hypothetical protein A2997_00100 [Candidatus Nomurabacteria bacterium RIFCSPLOWO2_01_FULL_36_10b]|uniref:HTH HARE-type domain-containing protein n=1 Tax=Candidatus Nomurabacteria bacterium RIFCSPLOWO2_01_FULL_36_10b TaxID=1801766 RepID=A0A1F6WMY2_9BACT|nr:MAG: hypothetical protein A2997_00100 [Candidatus Nomurabacteria bacterium RIFCSPLOWO2_01_FULL_36_10b]
MVTSNIQLNFKPKVVTKKLLTNLKDRARDVITKRYGLEEEDTQTLQAIGDLYGITRERVRQIENFALKAIRNSHTFAEAQEIFDELKSALYTLGGVVHEEHLLQKLSKDKVTQNHLNLYLVLGDEFTRLKEDNNFKARWTVDAQLANKIEDVLHAIHDSLNDNDLHDETEMVRRFIEKATEKNIPSENRNDDIARRLLWMSKVIGKNKLGHWGKSASPNIKTRGIRDLAYLVMRNHGSPMHFREVAKAISTIFSHPTHTATCHNELIKDERFVLIGRGMYGLKEWGYRQGTAREVIEQIIKEEKKPMSRDEIIDRVMKERYLKRNTILVNLQNPKFFKKNKEGMYSVV